MAGMETPELQQDDLVEKGERILTNRDLAARWQCSTSYLEKRDKADLPPRCAVLPGQIRYRLSDVERFEASRVDPNHPLTRSHLIPADSPEPPARRTGRPRAAVVAIPGFPIRLPVTIDPGRRRRGRPPKPAVDACDSG